MKHVISAQISRTYIGLPSDWGSPSHAAVVDMVRAVAQESKGVVATKKLHPRFGRLSRSIGIDDFRLGNSRILVPMMGPRWDTLAAGSLVGAPVVYAWDIWDSDIDGWVNQLNRYNVGLCMCSSSAAAGKLSGSSFRGEVAYVPEGIETSNYTSGVRLGLRPIHLLQLGRRSSRWHDQVTGPVSEAGFVQKFENRPGEIIFPSRTDLYEGLSSSAISVCFPRSMTHPQQASGVETFTLRYLESFASGCLVLGHAPPDLVSLFGYNPVVEVDWSDPVSQTIDILGSLSSYQNLVDRNIARVLEIGSWESRSTSILANLSLRA